MNRAEKYHQNMTNIFKNPNRSSDANVKRHLENLEKQKEQDKIDEEKRKLEQEEE